MVNTLLNADREDVVISEFAYTYYADGNQRTKTETLLGGDPITTTYVYDGLGRLTAETTGEDSITYTYDAGGNRTGMNRNGTVTAYAYDANNRLLSETVNGEITAYTYDANGNTLTAGDKTYTYNDRGQQTGYSNGTATASYAYNPSGLRKAKTVGGSTKYFVYNGMNIVYEYSESVADGVAYFYGLNRTHNSEGEIYVYNAHGDVVQLVKDNSVVASYTYDAFGNLTSQIGNSDNPFLYCGEYYDAETQTYYLRARYYNPANGRFTQQDAWAFMDTGDPLSLNLYTYCFNNPIMYVDPSGQFGVITTILAGATLISIMFLSGCANTIDNVPKDTTVFVASAEASPQPLTPIPEPVKEMTEEELAEQLAVAQTIYGEAGGSKKYPNEWKQGQEAVAWTIINRVQSSKYPDNPLQVVTAEGQFTGYMTGKKTYEAGACDEESWQYAYTLAEYIVKCAYHNIPYPAGFTNGHFEFRAEVGQDHRSMGRSGMVTYGGNTFFSTGGGR